MGSSEWELCMPRLFYETLYAAPSLTFEEIFGDFVDPYINIEEWDW